MKSNNIIKKIIYLAAIFCFQTITITAAPLGPDNAYTWGISNDALAIPQNSVITNATLIIYDAVFKDTSDSQAAYIHLLDNPDTELTDYIDNSSDDFFSTHGILLASLQPTDLPSGPADHTIELHHLNDTTSHFWTVFQEPFTTRLGNGTLLNYTSSMLSLVDYAGTGRSFGFGIDCDNFTCSSLRLELTIQSLTENTSPQTLLFQYGSPNTAPVMESVPDQSVDTGQVLTFTVSAIDADEDTLVYTSSTLPSGALFDEQTFTWRPEPSQTGSYTITFMVDDGYGGIDSTDVNISVRQSSTGLGELLRKGLLKLFPFL